MYQHIFQNATWPAVSFTDFTPHQSIAFAYRFSPKYPASLQAALFEAVSIHLAPFSFVGNFALCEGLEWFSTLNSILFSFSRLFLWEELGGPEKDLFVFGWS